MSWSGESVYHHYGLEDHLYKCSVERGEFKLLQSSYEMDKNKYTHQTAATAMSSGHYSLHDATHSKAIITNIERLLGEEQIRKLSPTDTWLILELAYSHDIGMYLSEEDIKRTWNTDAFLEYLISSSENGLPDIREAAGVFLNQNRERKTAEEALAYIQNRGLSGINALLRLTWYIKILATDYRRRNHAGSSAGQIPQFTESGTINGVPIRLYQTVAECSAAHGYSKEKVFSGKLEQRADGMSIDDMHPRFAAMLLRLGDLLDIDNNRFNPFVIAAFGSLPESSLPHQDKHLCITHKLVSPETIELSSDLTHLLEACAGMDREERTKRIARAYKETDHWFSMIAEELQFWHEREYDFIPQGFFPRIPRLKKREILIGEKTYSKAGILKEFSVDYSRMLSIIGARNFYKDPLSCLRELIQNSFDAVKRYLQRNLSINSDPVEVLEYLKEENQKLHVTISLCEKEINQVKYLGFAISDNGIGISQASLDQIRRVCSYAANKRQPVLLETAGEFGIGLHASFAVTDGLNYRTFSEEDQTKYQIEIEARNGGGRITVLPDEIKLIQDRKTHGTDVWFYCKEEFFSELLFGPAAENGTDYTQIISHLQAKLKEVIAPNLVPFRFRDVGPGADLDTFILKRTEGRQSVLWDSLLTGSDSFARDGKSWMWSKHDNYCILSLGAWLPACPVMLVLNCSESSESMKISHKGSWITGGRTDPRLCLRGLCAELHILGRTARSTVTTNRDALLAEAIPDLARDLTTAFRTLLLYLVKERRLDEVERPEVLEALACHYRALLQSTEEPEIKNLAQEAIDSLKERLQFVERDEYYFTSNAPDGPGSLEAYPASVAEIVCEDPVNGLWLRDNLIFQKIVGASPAVWESSLTEHTALYQDVWENYDLAVTVDSFCILSTGSNIRVSTLAVKYRAGKQLEPASTDEGSFELLLKAWIPQSCKPDPIQFIPAARFQNQGQAPEHPIHTLAVKGCDYRSYPVWKLFRTFIKMPVLFYAKQFDQLADDKKAEPLCYANLMDRCPEYLEMLVNYTLENQVEAGRYSKDDIREGYRFILEQLAK